VRRSGDSRPVRRSGDSRSRNRGCSRPARPLFPRGHVSACVARVDSLGSKTTDRAAEKRVVLIALRRGNGGQRSCWPHTLCWHVEDGSPVVVDKPQMVLHTLWCIGIEIVQHRTRLLTTYMKTYTITRGMLAVCPGTWTAPPTFLTAPVALYTCHEHCQRFRRHNLMRLDLRSGVDSTLSTHALPLPASRTPFSMSKIETWPYALPTTPP